MFHWIHEHVAMAGAVLLLVTADATFDLVITCPLLLATLRFAGGRRLSKARRRHVRIGRQGHRRISSAQVLKPRPRLAENRMTFRRHSGPTSTAIVRTARAA
jgi:hypothetical protein